MINGNVLLFVSKHRKHIVNIYSHKRVVCLLFFSDRMCMYRMQIALTDYPVSDVKCIYVAGSLTSYMGSEVSVDKNPEIQKKPNPNSRGSRPAIEPSLCVPKGRRGAVCHSPGLRVFRHDH